MIFACHGDQVLPILTGKIEERRDSKTIMANGSSGRRVSTTTEATIEEQDIFSCFQTTENECYLHSDLALMPNRRGTWSSWNYLIENSPSKLSHPAAVTLTYNMNILQHIPIDIFGDVLVTMNPQLPPSPDLTQGQYTYEHPLYTVEAVRAQERLEGLQNKRGVSYCGAWTKYGFHEDGFSSGIKVAMEHLGAKLPFVFQDSTYSRGNTPPTPLLFDHVMRLTLLIILAFLRVGERILEFPGVSLLLAAITFFPLLFLDLLESAGLLA